MESAGGLDGAIGRGFLKLVVSRMDKRRVRGWNGTNRIAAVYISWYVQMKQRNCFGC